MKWPGRLNTSHSQVAKTFDMFFFSTKASSALNFGGIPFALVHLVHQEHLLCLTDCFIKSYDHALSGKH